jgi:Fe-S-cluster-containing dehydrogenase component
MAKKLYIDMTKCRECEECVVECVYDHHPVNRGLKSLLETASFQYTCRRCEDAPCIEVCPAEALERNSEGVVERALNLVHSMQVVCGHLSVWNTDDPVF